MTLTKLPFGTVADRQVELYIIEFSTKLKASVTNYGGILTSLFLPDKVGKMENVVLGYENSEDYCDNPNYFGAIIGRCCNRIADGSFILGGREYSLGKNIDPNHLHGGIKGFDSAIWEVKEILETNNKVELVLQYISPDGEEGYPGTLTTTVTYIFTPSSWQINYNATTDKATVVNLTQHSYFNLSGNFKEDILSHELQISANSYLPVSSKMIPTGEIKLVAGTAFDFSEAKGIGNTIAQADQQLIYGNGYDHCWVLNNEHSDIKESIGSLHHTASGRTMEIYTDEPGMQFYSGNFLAGAKDGKASDFGPHSGLCLETQHYPNAPNQANFPSVILEPADVYRTSTIYKFSVK